MYFPLKNKENYARMERKKQLQQMDTADQVRQEDVVVDST